MLKRLAKGLFAGSLILLAVAVGLHFYLGGRQPLPERPDGALRVATHNVHYIVLRAETGRWSRGDWETRKPALSAAFGYLDADIVAFQEMESFGGRSVSSENLALDYLLAEHPDYAAAAVGDPEEFPSTQPILYRRERLTLLDQGWFFFSDTPDVIYSRTFNGSWPAFASWAVFEDREGRRVRVVNVHFEYRSRSNRRLSAALVARRVGPAIAAGERVILLGDINAMAGSATADTLAAMGVEFLPVRGATYHFDRGLNLFGAIDHVALSQGVVSLSAPVVVRERFEERWPSDHYPVVADIALR